MPIGLSASQWRVLNELGRAGDRDRSFVQPLVDEQAAEVADVVRLDAANLVRCFVGEARVDLAEHLAHDGSPMVVEARIVFQGNRYLDSPNNRALQCFRDAPGAPLGLLHVCRMAGVDWSQVEPLVHRKLMKVSRSLTHEHVEAHDVPKLPIDNLRATLTPRGRMFLPLD